MPHKVVHVITRLDCGGSAENTMLTLLGHDRDRYEPIVATGLAERWDAQGGRAATEENCRRLEKAGIRWIFVPDLIREVNPVKDVRALVSLYRLFRTERPVLVHTHTSKAGVLGRLAAWLARVPVIIHTPHGHVFYGHFGAFRSWIFVWIEKLLSHMTHWLIALTASERSDHLDRAVGVPERVAVIPSGIDVEHFKQAKSREMPRPSWMQCASDAVVIGSVGWLTPIKGHRYLVEAVGLLKPQFPRIHLVIVGTGELREDLMAQARKTGVIEALRLPGRREDIDVALAGMDLFVQPSLNEGMGRAVIEAMAAGLPVIATDVGGIPGVVEHERTGLLVPPGDARALAAAIRRCLENPVLARQLGTAAQASIGERFGVAAMVQAIEAIYSQALAGVDAR